MRLEDKTSEEEEKEEEIEDRYLFALARRIMGIVLYYPQVKFSDILTWTRG